MGFTMKYDEDGIAAFILNAIGAKDVDRFRPKIDRLTSLYLEYHKMRNWLDDNPEEVGNKNYKENITALNALMQNIRNLEEDINLFREKSAVQTDNALAARMIGKT